MAESDGLPGPRQRHRATASASARADVSYPRKRRSLLCISQSFSPDTTPTAIRASKLLEHLSAQWDIVVLTEAERPSGSDQPRVEVVRSWRPTRLIAAMRRLRLGKLLELLVWPDESIFWTAPAFLAGRRLIRELEPSAIVVFMMPYSAGLVGIALSRLSGLPLILNLDDSPTCTDMHPYFPTPMHYRLAKALEDFYARSADAVVYVSQTNLDTVSARQPEHVAEKFHLVRYGADRADSPPQDTRADHFEIAYVGAMSGWWTLIGRHASAGGLKRAYVAWNRLGRYELVALDQRTSSPAVIGRAIMDTFTAHPGWEGHVNLMIYGNPYPEPVVERAMASAGVQGVVNVLGPFP
ncbi:MAG TPA: glycosyltransferase, partial [Solirubrobacteraceae bacterium]|nr:glycosyltransferase [Solirubrobacteraceae bacterium]